MAPKGMKRPAGAEAEKLGRVSKALRTATARVSDSAITMLDGMAGASLGVPKSERHEFQASIVGMIGETLGAVRASQDEEVRRLGGEVDDCAGSKLAREAHAAQRERELVGLKEAISIAKAELDAAERARAEARDALQQAKKERSKGDKERARASAKLEAVQTAHTQHFGFVKESATRADSLSYKTVVRTCKDLGLESGILVSLAEVAKRPKEARTEFERGVLQKIDALFAQKVGEMTTALAESEAAKSARDEHVGAAQATLEQAAQRASGAEAALAAARDAERAGQRALKDAQRAVSGWLSDCKRAMDAYDAAVAAQADLARAESAFAELRDLEPPAQAEPESVDCDPAAAGGAPPERPVAE